MDSTHSEYGSVALVIQNADGMCRIMLSSVACSHYLTKGVIFGKKVIEHKMCVLIFYTIFSEKFIILRRTERDINIHLNRSSCKVPVILV